MIFFNPKLYFFIKKWIVDNSNCFKKDVQKKVNFYYDNSSVFSFIQPWQILLY